MFSNTAILFVNPRKSFSSAACRPSCPCLPFSFFPLMPAETRSLLLAAAKNRSQRQVNKTEEMKASAKNQRADSLPLIFLYQSFFPDHPFSADQMNPVRKRAENLVSEKGKNVLSSAFERTVTRIPVHSLLLSFRQIPLSHCTPLRRIRCPAKRSRRRHG